jgi:hypothetical protein
MFQETIEISDKTVEKSLEDLLVEEASLLFAINGRIQVDIYLTGLRLNS